MKKTKFTTIEYNGKLKPLFTLVNILVIFIFYVIPTIGLIYIFLYPDNAWDIIIKLIQKGFYWSIIVLFFSIIIYIQGIFLAIGTIGGKIRNLIVNVFTKKKNPYTYFRELPNDFGVGVTSLLFDSTLENEKDIVAVILDLCAKGYLQLEKKSNKYIIKILNKDSSNLLSNEKYILNLLINDNIKEINYREWYNYCLQDGIKLELYTQKNVKNRKRYFQYDESNIYSKFLKRTIIIWGIIWGFYFFFSLPEIIGNGFSIDLLELIIYIPLTFFAIYFGVAILHTIIAIINGIVIGIRNTIVRTYSDEVSNNLQKTKKGMNELHKLEAFKAFIKDFGSFADKYPEEIVLWDRYLSYAQVFGLTKEIMQCGYSKLVKNSSFQIDSIDNISFDNIEVC